MLSESGAQMQSTSYIPAYYSIRDQNVGDHGSLWQVLGNVSSTFKIGMVYNALPESPYSDPGLAYHKETLRQTMLEHEAVFRSQVRELHRLYSRQKQLMNELSSNRWQMQCSQSNLIPSQVQYNVLGRTLYSPPAPFGGNFQIPSTQLVVSQESTQASSTICIKEKSLEEQRIPIFEACYTGRRLFDLQLPAEEYIIDGENEQGLEERNHVQMPQVQHDHSQSMSSSPAKNTVKNNETSSSNGSSSCSKITFLFDLNEPIQLDDSETSNSADFINSGGTDIIVPHDQNSFGKSKLESHVEIKESTHDCPEGKGDEGSGLFSGLQDLAGDSKPLCGNSTNLVSEVSRKESEAFDDNNQNVLHSCITNSCSPALISNEAKTEASSSVSSQQTSICNSREVPIAIQALPCFNIPDLLSKTCGSSSSNSGNKRKYCNSKGNIASGPSLGSVSSCLKTGSNDNEHTAEHNFPAEADCVKRPCHATTCEDITVVDDGMPQNRLSKPEVSPEKHCRTANDDASSSNYLKMEFHGALVVKPEFDGTNLKEQVSTTDKNEHHHHPPCEEDIEAAAAAEAIVSISSSSSSDIQQCLKKNSDDCLIWFANIASSLTNNQQLMPRNNQNKLINVMNFDDPQSSTQNCKIKIHDQEEEQCRGKKKKRQKKGSVSCITSLDSNNIVFIKNVQKTSEEEGNRSSSRRRTITSSSRRRRRRRKVKEERVSSKQIEERKVCSLILKQHNNNNNNNNNTNFQELSLLGGGWGSKNRRQKKIRHC